MAKVKVVTLFMMVLLLLFSTLTFAARREPVFPNNTPAKTEKGGVNAHDALYDGCEALGEEECMIRRTLAAHTDYIYTQKQKP